jgi:hypothetical protein
MVLKDLGEVEKDKSVFVQRVPRPPILERNIQWDSLMELLRMGVQNVELVQF